MSIMSLPVRGDGPVATATAAALAPALPRVRRLRWLSTYRILLVLVDAIALVGAGLLALDIRFGFGPADLRGVSYTAVTGCLIALWLGAIALSGGYASRFVGTGSEEFKRVFNAAVRLVALLAVVAFSWKLPVARGYVAVVLPSGAVFVLVGRYAMRKSLHGLRKRGYCLHRVVVLGSAQDVRELGTQLKREPYTGFRLVGACLNGEAKRYVSVAGVPVLGTVDNVLDVLKAVGADTLAVTPGPHITSTELRRLAWQLEGSGVGLVVAPALTDVAGPRISIRPVAGLPLLHVDEPEFHGPTRGLTTLVERLAATVCLLLVAPLLGLSILAVRLGSPGPGMFRQTRVGRHGREFTVYKLRTMRSDAEELLADVRELNEHQSGPLFKIREDPRVTKLGRWLRRFSIDELPQLWNVVKGDMALVGPRPPLPQEVSAYGDDMRRRLLVKPGITGLWQVSGRSDLAWEDAVRLDLYYVENWSPMLDLLIIWKTLFAVLKRHGAY
jgi:exopolysaccharide biosynthesis polyprenyl glycosylphosphotransferase